MRKTTRVVVRERTVTVETLVRRPWNPFRKGERLLHTPSGLYGTAISFPGGGTGLVNFLFDRDRWVTKPIHRSQLTRV